MSTTGQYECQQFSFLICMQVTCFGRDQRAFYQFTCTRERQFVVNCSTQAHLSRRNTINKQFVFCLCFIHLRFLEYLTLQYDICPSRFPTGLLWCLQCVFFYQNLCLHVQEVYAWKAGIGNKWQELFVSPAQTLICKVFFNTLVIVSRLGEDKPRWLLTSVSHPLQHYNTWRQCHVPLDSH